MKKLMVFVLIMALVFTNVTSTFAKLRVDGTIELDTPISLECSENKSYYYYKFKPEESGRYCYYSSSDNTDIVGCIKDKDGSPIAVGNNYFKSVANWIYYYGDFIIECDLSNEETYYLYSALANASDGKYSICIEKMPLPSSIEIVKEDAYYYGLSYDMKCTFSPSNTADTIVSWTSSNPDVASIDNSGQLVANSFGTTEITVETLNGLTATAEIAVIDHKTVKLDEDILFNDSQDNITYGVKFDAPYDGQYTINVNLVNAPAGTGISLYVYDESFTDIYKAQGYSHYVNLDFEAGKSYYICYIPYAGLGSPIDFKSYISHESSNVPYLYTGVYESIKINGSDEIEFTYKFTPEKTSEYIFYSPLNYIDSSGKILDTDYNIVAESNNYICDDKTNTKVYDGAFCVKADLEAGQTYYLVTKGYNDYSSFDFLIDYADNKLGDVNQDGIFSAEDALEVLKYAARIKNLNDFNINFADINSDEVINAEDALNILKLAAKLI